MTTRRPRAPSAPRQKGQFFTAGNDPFDHPAFHAWAQEAQLGSVEVLEPFAGANHLIEWLQGHGWANSFAAFDIEPGHPAVQQRNTLARFPKGFHACVTNPPFLATYAAKRRGWKVQAGGYDDLYKRCLDRCLANVPYLAAIVPASFATSGLFHERLRTLVLMNDRYFEGTTVPVLLALWGPDDRQGRFEVYDGATLVGLWTDLLRHRPVPRHATPVVFNAVNGQLDLIAIDHDRGASIRFAPAGLLDDAAITSASRLHTRVLLPEAPDDLDVAAYAQRLNRALARYRRDTHDVLLTPFKGLRKDGRYRRRLDYATARVLIQAVSWDRG